MVEIVTIQGKIQGKIVIQNERNPISKEMQTTFDPIYDSGHHPIIQAIIATSRFPTDAKMMLHRGVNATKIFRRSWYYKSTMLKSTMQVVCSDLLSAVYGYHTVHSESMTPIRM